VTTTLCVGNAQIIGARPEQQDAFGFTDKDDDRFVSHGGLAAVVADGMGGHAGGREASQIAVKAFLQHYMAKPEHSTIPDALFLAFQAANRAVCTFAESTGEAGNCGTTLVAAVVHPATLTLHWIGAGDSRLYLFRYPDWVVMTIDTNYGNQLLGNHIRGLSLYDALDAEFHSLGLTSFLGLEPLTEIDRSLRGFNLHENDWIILCTDGVYNTLNQEEMTDCLIDNPQMACESLIKAVSSKNLTYQDNATVAIIACDFEADKQLHETKGSQRRVLILKLGIGLSLISVFAIIFLVGVYLGKSCASDRQVGLWGQIRSTFICVNTHLKRRD